MNGRAGIDANSSHLWRNAARSRIIWRLNALLADRQSRRGGPWRDAHNSRQPFRKCGARGARAATRRTGTGKLDEPTVTVEPMDFTDCKVTTAEPDADWERAIAKGGPGVGLSPQMPAFEDSLTAEQITGFVSHIRGFCKETGWPSGNTNFPRPIVTEKAFPENEFLILPAVAATTRSRRSSAVYERRLGKRSMVEIGVPVVSIAGEPRHGIDDLEVAFKHAVSPSAAPRIVSLGLETVLPTAASQGHRHGTAIFEPFISAGAMLRDWYLQGQVKVELPVDRAKADRAFVYNAYLGRDTSSAPNTWTLGIELNGENHELALTPQVRKGLTGTGALAASIGAMVPLNEREERGVRWVGYLLWEFLEPLRARR